METILAEIGVDWVLDWNRIANLIVVLLPFFSMVGFGFKYLLDRSERRDAARQAKAEERQEELETKRDERRAKEIEDMNSARAAFHADVLREATRMRELYEGELAGGLALRVSLAKAAQREIALQRTISELTRKVEKMQDELENLRRELKDKK